MMLADLSPQKAALLKHALTKGDENFYDFVLKNLNNIIAWLNSLEFEKYKHLKYPPLLNPNNVELDESLYCASLAWNLNLPLNVDYVFVTPHGSGAAAFLRCVNEVLGLCCYASWMFEAFDSKQRYEFYFQNKIKAINISEINILDFEKFVNLLSVRVGAIYLLRDPISILKHNAGRDWDHVKRNFKNNINLEKQKDKENIYKYLTHKKSKIKLNLAELKQSVFILNALSFFTNKFYVFLKDFNLHPFKTFKKLSVFLFNTPPLFGP